MHSSRLTWLRGRQQQQEDLLSGKRGESPLSPPLADMHESELASTVVSKERTSAQYFPQQPRSEFSRVSSWTRWLANHNSAAPGTTKHHPLLENHAIFMGSFERRFLASGEGRAAHIPLPTHPHPQSSFFLYLHFNNHEARSRMCHRGCCPGLCHAHGVHGSIS